ncbi:D-aminoacyl-tRNA deacylase-like [Ptychodera flava]|uniref:D-aminoacyl-tRNA deacylase-like n=1 Tax=Ptychodera flava TaxID=63121 RepID=UPI003969BE6B
MRDWCPAIQPMVLHSFSGSPEMRRWWSTTFQRCYFGFSGAVQGFDDVQKMALREVSVHRLLLESNSPHHQVRPGPWVDTPAYLGEVAQIVARVRRVRIEEVCQATTLNARQLYYGSRSGGESGHQGV